MVALVAFFSICVAAILLWIGFIISTLSSGTISSGSGYIVYMMGLFLPLVVLVMAMAFVYLSLELKRLQLKIGDWVKALRCDVLNDPVAVHEQIGALVQAQIEEPPAVLNISKNEPISKYQDMELPEDVELRFK